MKALLEFNLPEEQSEHQTAVEAGAWKYRVVHALDEQLRSWIKHGHPFQTADAALKNVRQRLHDLIEENNLTLDN